MFADENNNCKDVEATHGWWIFFIIILSFYTAVFILLVLLLAILGCCLCCLAGRDDPNSMGQTQIKAVISGLTKVPFDSSKHEEDCAICLEGFNDESELTVLRCNAKHYFHNHCIEAWVKEGKNTCPVCRTPIENFDEIKNMMEGGEFEFSLVSGSQNGSKCCNSQKQCSNKKSQKKD